MAATQLLEMATETASRRERTAAERGANEVDALRVQLTEAVSRGQMLQEEAEARVRAVEDRLQAERASMESRLDAEVRALQEALHVEHARAEAAVAEEREQARTRAADAERHAAAEAEARVRAVQEEARRREEAAEAAGRTATAAEVERSSRLRHRAEAAEDALRLITSELAAVRAELATERERRVRAASEAEEALEMQRRRHADELERLDVQYADTMATLRRTHQRELADVVERATDRQIREYRGLMDRYLIAQAERSEAVVAEAAARRRLRDVQARLRAAGTDAASMQLTVDTILAESWPAAAEAPSAAAVAVPPANADEAAARAAGSALDAAAAIVSAAEHRAAARNLTGPSGGRSDVATDGELTSVASGMVIASPGEAISSERYATVLEAFSSEISHLRHALNASVRDKSAMTAQLSDVRAALTTAVAQRESLRGERELWRQRLEEQATQLTALLEDVRRSKARLVEGMNALVVERQGLEEERAILRQREAVLHTFYSHLNIPLPPPLFSSMTAASPGPAPIPPASILQPDPLTTPAASGGPRRAPPPAGFASLAGTSTPGPREMLAALSPPEAAAASRSQL